MNHIKNEDLLTFLKYQLLEEFHDYFMSLHKNGYMKLIRNFQNIW